MAHERRSFLPEHACDLWVGDVMHGPRVRRADGQQGKSYLVTILDAATRFVIRSRFCADKGMLSHENVLLAAIEHHGLPRAYYVDRGAAYVADSLAKICADLGVHLIHTKARDPEAKGCIERWHRTLRDELLDELPPDIHTLDGLNAALWAWLSIEYHARTHSTTGRAPGLHFESELAHLRPVPGDINLRDVFLHRETRLVHKDGCVRFQGGFYEVPGDLVGERVELRFDPRRPDDSPLVFLESSFTSVRSSALVFADRGSFCCGSGRLRRLFHAGDEPVNPRGRCDNVRADMNETSQKYAAMALVVLLAISGWLWWHRSVQPAMPLPVMTEAVELARSTGLQERSASQIERQFPGRASIAGTVRDLRGARVRGAQVCATVWSSLLPARETWRPNCTMSAQNGNYRLEGLMPVRHRVTAAAAGYAPGIYGHGEGASRREQIDLRPAMEAMSIDIELEDGGVEVKGSVHDLSGGSIEGAQIVSDRAFTRTDGEGMFSMWVRPGTQFVVADAEGYASGFAEGDAPGHMFRLFLTPETILVGRVVRVGSGAPVDGAMVKAGAQAWGSNHQAFTDADGYFRIEGLEPGVYKPYSESDDSMGRAAEQVLLGLGETSMPVQIEAHPAYFVEGRIVAEGGAPCENGWVSLQDRANARGARGMPEVDGNVRILALSPGVYQVNLGCTGHLAAEAYEPVTILETSVAGVTWTVTRGQTISGQVVDAEGRPLAHLEVRATARVAPNQPRVRQTNALGSTDVNGHFELAGLLAGHYDVSVAGMRATPPKPISITLPEKRDIEGVRIELPATGTVRGSVVDLQGRPAAKSRVVLHGDGEQRVVAVADNGSFIDEHVALGEYRVVAEGPLGEMRAPGSSDGEVQGEKIEVRAGEVESIKLIVEGAKTGVITGIVRGSDGGPIADAFVDATRESESEATSTGPAERSGRWGQFSETPHLTDVDGRFTLTALPEGKYTLRAYRKGGGEAILEHVELGGPVALTIAATGRLSGTVVVPGGSPPDEFTLQLVDETTGFSRRDTFFRTGGAWSLPDVPAGHFKIRINAGVATAEVATSMRAGEDTSGVRVELAAKVTVRGSVVDLEGHPASGLQVSIYASGRAAYADSDNSKLHVTDASGRFELKNVPTGPVQVFVSPQNSNDDRKFGSISLPAHISSAASTVELPPIRMPRARVENGEKEGDLGYKLKVLEPGADPLTAGLQVAVVRAGGPAAMTGLQIGDEIVRIDGQDVTGANGYLHASITAVPAGTVVTLGLKRGADVKITADKQP